MKPAALLLLLALPVCGAEVVLDTYQADDGSVTDTAVNLRLINNDPGAIYNSATLDLDAMFGSVVEEIVERNPAYSNPAQVYEALRRTIQPESGSVDFGWAVEIDNATGMMSFTNNGGYPDVTYDEWRDNVSHTTRHTLWMTIGFDNMLDFNASGVLEADERIVDTGGEAAGGFEGYQDIDNSFYAPVPVLRLARPRLRVTGIDVEPVAGGMEVVLSVIAEEMELGAGTVSVEHAAGLAGPWSPIGSISGDGESYTGTVTAPEGGVGFVRVVGP